MLAFILVIFAYILGSIATAVLVCKAFRLPDPRNEGSGNPGATNVLRTGHKKAAALTLLGDIAKGLLPLLIARALHADSSTLALVGIAAILGHIYPIFFGFRGGKGVATALGVLLGTSLWLGLAVLATWLLTAKITRTSSLAAVIATLLAPIYAWLFQLAPPLLSMVGVICVLVLWRHRENIRRLLAGTEHKIAKK